MFLDPADNGIDTDLRLVHDTVYSAAARTHGYHIILYYMNGIVAIISCRPKNFYFLFLIFFSFHLFYTRPCIGVCVCVSPRTSEAALGGGTLSFRRGRSV